MRKDKNKDITRNRGKRRLVIIIIMAETVIPASKTAKVTRLLI